MIFQSKRFNWFVILIMVFFGLIFCSISLTNHYLFRTYAHDLGINYNAIYDYCHFRFNNCMLLQPQFDNLLSDHFSLTIIPISFLYYITGSYTLLLFQIVMILVGGLGIYRFFMAKFSDQFISLAAMIHFYLIWGIYSSLAYDYHDNVIAAMLVPWLFYFIERTQYYKALIILIFIMITKENMALWSVFIMLGLAIEYRKNKRTMKNCIAFSSLAIVYFAVIMLLVMPSLTNESRHYLHMNYSIMGNGFFSALNMVYTEPLKFVKVLFMNQTHNPELSGFEFDDIKSELWIMFLFSGGIFLLLRPQYLLMLLPIFIQKLFNDDVGKWGINYHYSIEFTPILAIGSFCVIATFNKLNRKRVSIFLVLLTAFMTIKSIDARVSPWYKSRNHRFYAAHHYYRNFDVDDVYKSIKKIPEDAKLCAQSTIVPHVAFREYIYLFPNYENADYIIVNEHDDPYPFEYTEQLIDALVEIKSNINWSLISKEDGVLIFHRNKGDKK